MRISRGTSLAPSTPCGYGATASSAVPSSLKYVNSLWVRGNPIVIVADGDLESQLPVGTGQPAYRVGGGGLSESTPCGYGATTRRRCRNARICVNSLWVRGNPWAISHELPITGQLPVGTGQPREGDDEEELNESTPCGYGATGVVQLQDSPSAVNSLWVRGNPSRRDIVGVDLSAFALCPRPPSGGLVDQPQSVLCGLRYR